MWDNQEEFDAWCNELVKNCPESWDGEEAITDVVRRYVHTLEERLKALSPGYGDILLERYDPTDSGERWLETVREVNPVQFLSWTEVK